MRLTALVLSVLAFCCSVCVCILFTAKRPVRYEIAPPNITIIVASNGKTTVTTTRTTKRVTIRLKGTDKEVHFTL